MKKAYILTIVIFVTGFISSVLSLTLLWVNYYLKLTNKNINKIVVARDYFNILDEVIDYFDEEIRIEYTSPFDGWFSKLPENIGEYTIRYVVEDSKIDINHLDLKIIADEYMEKDLYKNEYFYNNNDFEKIIKNNYRAKSGDIFSISIPPNLNTSDMNRLLIFLQSQYFTETSANNLIERVKYYRGLNDKYMFAKGLIINEDKYLNIKTYLDRSDEDLFYIYFDYTGSINLNFVTHEVFNIAFNLVVPKQQSNSQGSPILSSENLWKRIESKREFSSTITDIKEIFGNSTEVFKKIFSVDSKVFKIEIERDDNILFSIIKRYKNYRGVSGVYILKNSFTLKDKTRGKISDDE